MTHVRTSPYYPQSNGKIERWHKTLKGECIRPQTPLSLADARRIVAGFVERYNTVRLHSAIGFVTPQDKLLGRDPVIFAERDRKLALARDRRAAARQDARRTAWPAPPAPLQRHRPGRRIGLRWEPTRAPTQGPRPHGAARCRPTFPAGLAPMR